MLVQGEDEKKTHSSNTGCKSNTANAATIGKMMVGARIILDIMDTNTVLVSPSASLLPPPILLPLSSEDPGLFLFLRTNSRRPRTRHILNMSRTPSASVVALAQGDDGGPSVSALDIAVLVVVLDKDNCWL